MAIDKEKKSNRLLASRRYTHATLNDNQEAFTSVLDINASEVYSQQNLIPASSLPYSSSDQDQELVIVDGNNILKYYHQFELTPSNVVNGNTTEVFFFISKSGHDPTSAVTPQILQDGQQGSFISPKYSDPSLTNADAEDNPPGYNVTIRVNGTKQNAANYQFDYKDGILQFDTSAPSTGATVVASVYQYIGQTLADNSGGTEITNPGDNRILTSDGTATGILAENHMLFTGELLSVSSSIEITGSINTDPFIIKLDDGNGQDEKIKVNNEGILILGNLDTVPTAVTGGLYYSNGSFYVGI